MTGSGRLLLFGATGAIGRCVADSAIADGWAVTAVSRRPHTSTRDQDVRWLAYDPMAQDADFPAVDTSFDAVCWAQGANMTDSLRSFDPRQHIALYEANCLSVLIAAAALVERGLLSATGARLVVVSSIWQERARQDKLSYTVTKAAIGGLVRAASVDLARDGHFINAVLPGVLDTPMTAANLSAEQLSRIRAKTDFARLPDLATLAATILFLCSPRNNSITGQSINVDLGMSNANLV